MLAPGGAARHEVFEYAELQFDYVRVKAMMAPAPTHADIAHACTDVPRGLRLSYRAIASGVL